MDVFHFPATSRGSSVTNAELPQAALGRIEVLVLHLAGGAIAYGIGEQGPVLGDDPTNRQRAPTLADLLTQKATGRTDAKQISRFYNVPGSGMQFAAAGLRM